MSANLLVVAGVLLAGIVLLRPRLLRSPGWRATVTPLASIIGSGFLVLAPLLVREFGSHAVAVMAGLCAVAYLIGAAIRWNIRRRERGADGGAVGAWLERASSWTLVFAYVVSVAYYLNLFGAFALSLMPAHPPWAAKAVTSAMLLVIAALGWWRGLAGLERAETVSVTIKLSIIAGLLAGMALHTWTLHGQGALQHGGGHFDSGSLRIVFGLIITVQGFETSRYLREAYDAETRVRTMRRAQWLSAAIYIVYIAFAGLDFDARHVPLQETAVIAMTAAVASWLPMLLVLAALAAQFSAAVADTNGSGGLAQEMSSGRISSREAYVVLVVLALALTWTADIYAIISDASRAFAAYYALQCALAAWTSRQARTSALRTAGFTLLGGLMLAATVLGVPAS